MKKFKLIKNDSKSLQNAVNMVDNPVLKNAILDVTNADYGVGGFSKGRITVDFAKALKKLD